MKAVNVFIATLCLAFLSQPVFAETSDTDALIDQKAEAALLFNGKLNTRDIHAHVSNGHVHLIGEVDSYADRLLAQDVIARLDGVRSIDNQLSVRKKRQDKFPLLSVRSTLKF